MPSYNDPAMSTHEEQEQIDAQARYLADLRCEEAEREVAAERDRQQERPHADSPSNRCSNYRHNYACGHVDSRHVRDARCWVCEAQGSPCSPETVDIHRSGGCPRCDARKEMERERRREAERRKRA